MKHSITIALPEIKRLEVNGIEFDVIADDLDVIQQALEIERVFKGVEISVENSGPLCEAAQRAANYVDVILGLGAMAKITGGRAVGAAKKIEIMSAICIEVMRIYQERVDSEYE